MKELGFMAMKDGYLGALHKEPSLDESKVLVIPFPIEKTVSYGGGTDKGPAAIIDASHQVELFDEELECEPYRSFMPITTTMPKIATDHQEALDQIESLTNAVYEMGKFPLILGGEHSLTIGTAKAAKKKYSDLSILYFDAHGDMRDGYDGSPISHAAALRRVLDDPSINAVHVGCRNLSQEEFDFVKTNPNRVKMFFAKDMPWDIDALVNILSEHVFLSFDVDVFDSSLMPSTGTPEPGGINWWTAMKIIRAVCEKKTLVGADFSECAPILGMHAPDFLVAKLTYKTLAYKFVTGHTPSGAVAGKQ